MGNSDTSPATAESKTGTQMAKASRSQSAPADLGREPLHKLSGKNISKLDKPTAQDEGGIYKSNLNRLLPSLKLVDDRASRVRTGGVPMERQYGRRANLGRRPPTAQSAAGSSAEMRQESTPVSSQRPFGGEAMQRGGGFLSQGNGGPKPGEVRHREFC